MIVLLLYNIDIIIISYCMHIITAIRVQYSSYSNRDERKGTVQEISQIEIRFDLISFDSDPSSTAR